MELEFKADPANEPHELYIHLDVEGLAALLKAVEAAMRTGHGVLSSDACSPHGAIIGTVSPHAFAKVNITFDRPGPGRGGKMPN
jgi:hypothetical protein